MSQPETKRIHCVVVTPESTVLEADTDFVALPAYDGELGVLPGRAPLVARLGPGELRLKAQGEAPKRFFVDGGFAQILSGVVTVLTPRAEPIAQLDLDALIRELSELNTQVPAGDDALDQKARRILRARARIHLAGK